MASAPPSRLLPALASLAAVGLAASLALGGLAWWLWQRPVELADLDPEARERLGEELLAASPGLYRSAPFEPAIGYTMAPDRKVTAWGTRVRSNEIGYRGPALAKSEGVFRLLFVGDSWTFGMGVEEDEAFPAVAAEWARRETGREIEAFTLALPGYNVRNQLAALRYFRHRLQPDAVIFVPSANDHFSANIVLPNGSQGLGRGPDRFGDPHTVFYPSTLIDSFRIRDRWAQAFAAWREASEELEADGIPTAFFFVARWRGPWVEALLSRGRLDTRFAVIPPEYTLGRWSLPPPAEHGTAEAHRLYGRAAYRLIAAELGWQSPAEEAIDVEIPIRRSTEIDAERAERRYRRQSRFMNRRLVEESFRPGDRKQVAGILGPDGVMGEAVTILLRRGGAGRVVVRFETFEAAGLYPLVVSAVIPLAAGTVEASMRLERPSDEPLELGLELPEGLHEDDVLDVVITADRTVSRPDRFPPRSLRLLSVGPG